MAHLQDIMAQVQKFLTCQICGRRFGLEEIKLRGYFDSTYFFQTSCENGHLPVMMIFVATFPQKVRVSERGIGKKIDYDEVIDAAQVIDSFQGEFSDIFRK